MEQDNFRQLLLNRTSLGLLAIALLTEALLLILAALNYYPRIVNVDGIYSAQIARNLLTGKGYTTSEMTLYEVNLYSQKGWLLAGPPWPNSGRFPLPVMIRAGLFLITGYNFTVATYLYSMTFQVVAVASVFVVGLYLFRERLPAFFSSILFAASPILIFSGISGKETSSDYLFFMMVLALVYSWRKRSSISLGRLFLLGLIVGLTYLNRFNLGGVIVLTLIPLVVKDVIRKKYSPKTLATMTLVFAAGLGLIVSPLAIYNTNTFGNPAFSSNALFQFVQFTQPAKYMNPWWKLSYPFDTAAPLSALGMFSGDITRRTLDVVHSSFIDFVNFGQASSGYTLFWWIPIGATLAAQIWGKFGRRTGFSFVTGEQSRALNLVWYFIISNLVLDLPILGLFSAGVEYIWYLYSTMALIAGFGVSHFFRLIQQRVPNKAPGPNRGGRFGELIRKFSPERIGLILLASILLVIAFDLSQFSPMSSTTLAELEIFALVGTLVGFVLFRLRPSILPFLLIVLVISVPVARYGIVGGNASPDPVPSWITDQNTGIFNFISSNTPPNGVVLSAEPWNVVWFADRPSLAFSEFPDEIYLMMTTYHLNIQGVYIANLNSVFYGDVHAPYTYEGYRRIAQYNYTIAGFRQAESGYSVGQPSLLLLRDDSVNPQSLLQTTTVDFGNSSDSNHFVWGWSPISPNFGLNSTWAERPGGTPLSSNPGPPQLTCQADFEAAGGRCLPDVTYNSNGQSFVAGVPDAEFTFLSTSTASRTMVLNVLSPVANQTMMIVLNSNLVYFGQEGTLLTNCNCTIRDPNTWVHVSVQIPSGVVQNGVNLVTFIFPGNQTANYYGQTEKLLLFEKATLS
jgi:hypothetical protein